MIKLFVSDIDGTFLNGDHVVSKATKEALDRLVESGVRVMLASGRNYVGIKFIIDEVAHELECIPLNGAQYCDKKGNNVLLHSLNKECLATLQPLLLNHPSATEIYTKESSYTNLEMDNLPKVYTHNLMKMSGMSEGEVASFLTALNFEAFMETEKEVSKIFENEILKVEFHFDNKTAKLACMKDLSTIPATQISTSVSTNVEVTNEKASKGDMLAHICELYNIQNDEVVVIGDSMNDVSMLTMFKHSVAMGNSAADIQSKATYVCDSNENDGCAKVMNAIVEYNTQCK